MTGIIILHLQIFNIILIGIYSMISSLLNLMETLLWTTKKYSALMIGIFTISCDQKKAPTKEKVFLPWQTSQPSRFWRKIPAFSLLLRHYDF